MWYAYVIGYGFSVLGAAILVKSVVEWLWNSVAPESSPGAKSRPHSWQGEVLARIEGVLYVAFLELGLGGLIGVWLALKVAGHWKRWMEDGNEATQQPDGRTAFNIFLIGNSLSLLYAIVGFRMIGWVLAGDPSKVAWVALGTFLLTFAFWAWIPGLRKSRFL